MLAERMALLRTIITNPTDKTAHMVYADWLDDHAEKGNGFAQHAKCIRWRCEEGRPKPTQYEFDVSVRCSLGPLKGKIKVTYAMFAKSKNIDDRHITVDLDICGYSCETRYGFVCGLPGVLASSWIRFGPQLVTLLPLDPDAFYINDFYLNARVEDRDDGTCYWVDPNVGTPKAIPWLDPNNVVYHETSDDEYSRFERPIDWFSSQAFLWAKKQAGI